MCTIVIEVGIDIPDDNIILIDQAEMFGMAQIHQLRGRVGRGRQDGLCILLYKKTCSPHTRGTLPNLENQCFPMALLLLSLPLAFVTGVAAETAAL